ncbi:MAG: Trm112 family protein [Alphaproteobacteria bacterium]
MENVEAKLLESLTCPITKRPLRYDKKAQELISDEAKLAFPIKDGVPIIVVSCARSLD